MRPEDVQLLWHDQRNISQPNFGAYKSFQASGAIRKNRIRQPVVGDGKGALTREGRCAGERSPERKISTEFSAA
jgi:hypothetical protein